MIVGIAWAYKIPKNPYCGVYATTLMKRDVREINAHLTKAELVVIASENPMAHTHWESNIHIVRIPKILFKCIY